MKMRINFTCIGLMQGGGNKTVLNLAKQLSARHDVTITAQPHNGGRDHEWFGPAPCRINYIRPSFMDRLRSRDDYSKELIAATPDCDANIATYYPTAFTVADSGKGTGCYFIQHDESIMAADCNEAARVRRSYELPLKHLCVSAWVACGINGGGRVVGNGIDPDVFNPGAVSIREPETVMAFIRGIGWKKDALALEALRLLQLHRPSVRAIMVCPPGRDSIIGIGAKLRREYHTSVSEKELATLYRRASVFLSTSEKEGFGLPPLEAMACGCPVVANNYTNAGHVNSSTALLADDAFGLAKSMEQMFKDDVRNPFIETGLRVAKAHDIKLVAERFENALKEAVK